MRAARGRAASPARPEPAPRPTPLPPPPPPPAAPELEAVAEIGEEEAARRAKGLAAEFFRFGDAGETQLSMRVRPCACAVHSVPCPMRRPPTERRLHPACRPQCCL